VSSKRTVMPLGAAAHRCLTVLLKVLPHGLKLPLPAAAAQTKPNQSSSVPSITPQAAVPPVNSTTPKWIGKLASMQPQDRILGCTWPTSEANACLLTCKQQQQQHTRINNKHSTRK
jgi:hypothetical protein